MSISIREFEVAMNGVGGKPVTPKEDVFLGHSHLRFEINKIFFEHSGEECVFLMPSNPRSMELLKLAKYYLKSTQSNTQISSNKIFSVRELLALCLIIENKFSIANLNKQLNLTFETLQKIPVLRKAISNNYRGGIVLSESAQKLYNLIKLFDNCVNPFCGFTRTNKPCTYLKDLDIGFDFDPKNTKFILSISSTVSLVEFKYSNILTSYYAEYLNDSLGESYTGYTSVSHIFYCETKEELLEIHVYSAKPVCVIMNLTNGLVKIDNNNATPATEANLNWINVCLESSIHRLTSTITGKIVTK